MPDAPPRLADQVAAWEPDVEAASVRVGPEWLRATLQRTKKRARGIGKRSGFTCMISFWLRVLAAVEADVTLRLHDLRHCYGQWLSDAGQFEARIHVGMRHATAAMTRRYAKQRDNGENARVLADALVKSA